MLDKLFNDIINDIVAPRESTSLAEERVLTKQEVDDVCRIAGSILETIPGCADEYLDYLDKYIRDYQERYCEGEE